MTTKRLASQVWQSARTGLASLVMLQLSLAGPMAGSAQGKDHDGEEHSQSRTPITPATNQPRPTGKKNQWTEILRSPGCSGRF